MILVVPTYFFPKSQKHLKFLTSALQIGSKFVSIYSNHNKLISGSLNSALNNFNTDDANLEKEKS